MSKVNKYITNLDLLCIVNLFATAVYAILFFQIVDSKEDFDTKGYKSGEFLINEINFERFTNHQKVKSVSFKYRGVLQEENYTTELSVYHKLELPIISELKNIIEDKYLNESVENDKFIKELANQKLKQRLGKTIRVIYKPKNNTEFQLIKIPEFESAQDYRMKHSFVYIGMRSTCFSAKYLYLPYLLIRGLFIVLQSIFRTKRKSKS